MEMGLFHLLVLSLLFISVAPNEEVNPQGSCSSKSSGNIHNFSTNAMHLTLHHPRDPCSPAPLPPLPFSTVLENDDRRVHALSRRITRSSRGSKASAVSSPLSPGISLGVGNYITSIGLGSPSKPYTMVVDTGSSLSWLQCSPCSVSCHQQVGSVFNPKASTSYSTIPCSAAECSSLTSATLNPPGCISNVCVYAASYGDSSFSVGYLSRDTLSIGSLSVPSFVFGCGQDNEGVTFGMVDGLIGLAKNKLSLFSQVAAMVGSTAFSYCLPTLSSTGYVSFGPYDASKFSYTPMVTNPEEATLYYLDLSGITVGGTPIAATPSAYSSLPTIIDSGTVVTRLPTDVYSALSKSLSAALSNYTKAPPYSILDTCFVGSVNNIAVPEVSLVFAGGATMRLSARNVLADVSSSTTCLVFAQAQDIAIIGNYQQQTFDVVYDVDMARIGSAAGGCQ